ncbi:MAG TPA: tetratricopeptide repeat protein [Bryobacteraceae bacterium]|nr:tetratricopeptide repeat protein [Bryobacteraceae bacterium]
MRALWLAALAIPALAAPPVPAWRLTRSEHFEIYAQSSDQRARAILTWFEQLRSFFQQQGAGQASSAAPVRVIVFASPQQYQPYRLQSNADAYYVGAQSRDYIVMGTDDPARFGIAAHEYAHLVLRTSGAQLPPWLKEGLAEFFATLRITGHATELGGVLPGRLQTLQRRTWMPLTELLSLSPESQSHQERAAADLFYAESWALTEMLLLSPKYAPGFQKILASPNLDAAAATRDLHQWMDQPVLPVIQLPEVITPPIHVEVSAVSPLASRLLLAQVLLLAGEFDRAEALFHALAREAPDSAEVSAALGAIALHKGDAEGARRHWKQSIDQGIADAQLCYRYAVLADDAGLPAADIRPALERAIALQPDFDDAHYQLALLEKNARRYEAALREFHAMRTVAEARSLPYWLALADTFNELGRSDEAEAAARNASRHASTAAERARAAQEAYIAQTEPGVQFARDASGHLQLVTTRMPRQQSEWNPFIEAADDIHRVQGTLREIDCGSLTTIHVEAAGKVVKLAIPDLQHVQMRHAPDEFVCGPQPATPVTIDYARSSDATTQGIVRGMDFSPAGAP